MDAKLMRRMEGMLLAERDRTADVLRQIEADEAEPQSVSDGELSHFPVSMADAASDVQEEEADFLTATRATRHLHEVDDALRALAADPDSLGACARCAGPIEAARLELVPWSRLCARCARADGKLVPELL